MCSSDLLVDQCGLVHAESRQQVLDTRPDRLELGRVGGQGVDELDNRHAQRSEHHEHEGVDENNRADGGHGSGHVDVQMNILTR